jgi:hypothetical protein
MLCMSRSAGQFTDRSAQDHVAVHTSVFLGTQTPPSRSASSFAGAARASKGRVNLKSSGDEDVMGPDPAVRCFTGIAT